MLEMILIAVIATGWLVSIMGLAVTAMHYLWEHNSWLRFFVFISLAIFTSLMGLLAVVK